MSQKQASPTTTAPPKKQQQPATTKPASPKPAQAPVAADVKPTTTATTTTTTTISTPSTFVKREPKPLKVSSTGIPEYNVRSHNSFGTFASLKEVLKGQTGNLCLCGIGKATTAVITVLEILKKCNLVETVSIETSTLQEEEKRSSKLVVVVRKTKQFDVEVTKDHKPVLDEFELLRAPLGRRSFGEDDGADAGDAAPAPRPPRTFNRGPRPARTFDNNKPAPSTFVKSAPATNVVANNTAKPAPQATSTFVKTAPAAKKPFTKAAPAKQ